MLRSQFTFPLIALLHFNTRVSIIRDFGFCTALEKYLPQVQNKCCVCSVGDRASHAVAAVHFLRRLRAYTGRKAARSRLPCVVLSQEKKSFGGHGLFHVAGTRKRGRMGNGNPRLTDLSHLTEIGSLESPCENCKLRAGCLPTVLPSFKFSDKCDPSPLDGYSASSLRLLALSHLQDAGLTRFIGPTKRCVAACTEHTSPLGVDDVYRRPLAG